MDIIALALPLVVVVVFVVVLVALRREFRRRIWGEEGNGRPRGRRRR